MSHTLNRATFAVSVMALFIALGGHSYAAKIVIGSGNIKSNAVKANHIQTGNVKAAEIATGAVRSSEIQDGSVAPQDLSAALLGSLGQIPDNSITAAKLAADSVDGGKVLDKSLLGADLADDSISAVQLVADSVTTSELADNSVTSAKVAPNTLVAADLASSSVGAAELAANTVQGDEVQDGSLDGDDIGIESGSASVDVPNVGANSCEQHAFDTGTGADMRDAAITLTVEDTWPDNLSVSTENSDSVGYIRMNVCNPTGGAINPAALDMHWVALDPRN